MVRARSALFSAVLAVACRFEPGHVALRDGDVDGPEADGPADPIDGAADASPADAIDAGPCSNYPAALGGSRYRVGTGPLDWFAARADCEADGAHLAFVNDASENSFIAGIGGSHLWIGLTDHDTENSFLWMSGDTTTAFASWESGQPNNSGNAQDCVELNTGGIWNDKDCRDSGPWVCECDSEVEATPPTWCDTTLEGDCGQCGVTCPGSSTCTVSQTCT